MSDHQKYALVAQKIVGNHGRDLMFRTLSDVPVDTNKPWLGSATTPTDIGPLKGVFVPFRGLEFGMVVRDEELFKHIRDVCLVAGGQADVETAHLIIDEGKEYKVNWVQKLKPGDQTVLYAFGIES